MDSSRLILLIITLTIIWLITAACRTLAAQRKKNITCCALSKQQQRAQRLLDIFTGTWPQRSAGVPQRPPLDALQMAAEILFFPPYEPVTNLEMSPEALPIYREELKRRRREYPASHNANLLHTLNVTFTKLSNNRIKRASRKIARAGECFDRLCSLEEQALDAYEHFYQARDGSEKKSYEDTFRSLHYQVAGEYSYRYTRASENARWALLALGGSEFIRAASELQVRYHILDETAAAAPARLLHIIFRAAGAPFAALAHFLGKLGFALCDCGCLFYTAVILLPLAVTGCALLGGVLVIPAVFYQQWSAGNIMTALLWVIPWLLCLLGMPGLLAGLRSAYRDERLPAVTAAGIRAAAIVPVKLKQYRLLLIPALLGIVMIPVITGFWPGLVGSGSGSGGTTAGINIDTLTAAISQAIPDQPGTMLMQQPETLVYRTLIYISPVFFVFFLLAYHFFFQPADPRDRLPVFPWMAQTRSIITVFLSCWPGLYCCGWCRSSLQPVPQAESNCSAA